MIKGLRVLVTGCSGFLGPWLCEKLLERGARVTGVDIDTRKSSRIHQFLDSSKIFAVDVRDFDQLDGVIVEERIEFVFHLAAQALVGVALSDPRTTLTTNIDGTVNVLEIARKLDEAGRGLRGVIVASSDKAYGDQDDLPYREDAPMQGRFPYDVSKSCADLISRSYYETFKLPICVTRCGNLYGGGDLNWSRIIPGTIRSYLEKTRPIIRSDGTPVRDYIYVEDAAAALLAIGDRMLVDGAISGEAFNISDDRPHNVLQIVEQIRKVMDIENLPPVVESSAKGEIQQQFLSSSKLRGLTEWAPLVSLEEGLEKTVDWYRDHLG